MNVERKRYDIRHEDYGGGEWLHVIDTKTNKVIARYYGWDSGWPEAHAHMERLNKENSNAS